MATRRSTFRAFDKMFPGHNVFIEKADIGVKPLKALQLQA